MARQAQSSFEYWLERNAARRMDMAQQAAADVAARAAYAHIRALETIQEEMTRLFGRFSEGLDPQDARRMLHSEVDNNTYDELMQIFQTATSPSVKEAARQALNREPLKYRIQRQEAMRQTIANEMMKLADNDTGMIESFLKEAAQQTMDQGAQDIAQLVGMDFPARPISQGRLDQMVKAPWSGEDFSTRVWNNLDELGVRMNEAIPQGMMAGKSHREIAKDLEDLTDQGNHATERLVRTETTHVVAEADKESAKSRGAERMKFSAILDSRTSKVCTHMDGKIIPIDELQPGKNQPPMHPHCRSVLLEVNPRMDAIRARLAARDAIND